MPSRLLSLISLTFLLSASFAEERGPVYFTMDIEAQKWEALEVKNLPARIEVSVDIRTDGDILALFLNSSQLQRFPNVEHPLFMGAVREKLHFTVTTPTPDHYYVVMRNMSQETISDIELVVSAKHAEDPAAGSQI